MKQLFLFALMKKLSPREAARCDWTDVRGDMWNARRCLGLTGAESCHIRLAAHPALPCRPVGFARLAGEHHLLQSEWMVLEEASSFDTNLDTSVESCSSLSPKSLLLPTSYTKDIFLPFSACIFSMSFLGSVTPDERADS